jgi:hypothetical protein
MVTPTTILRKRADEALAVFAASSGHDPEEVWESLVKSPNSQPPLLVENLFGGGLWEAFRELYEKEKSFCR